MRINDTLMIGFVVSVAALVFMITPHAAPVKTGFILAAPDRGFMGNSETQDAFIALDETYPAELVFVTDERGRDYFDAAVERLKREGASNIIVLPLYLSDAHPDFRTLQTYMSSAEIPVKLGRIFGQSVAAPIVLADRLRALPGESESVVITGATMEKAIDAKAMQADLERIAAAVQAEFPQMKISSAVWSEENGGMEAGLKNLPEGTTAVPFHFSSKLDSMMAYTAYLQYAAPDGVTVIDSEITPHPAVGAWLQREAARNVAVPDEKIGVVVHAHGSDFQWNETMRKAAAPLAENYLVEYAFSMGDPPTLARAIERLEERGAKAAVIVRVFGLERSFSDGTDRFIGSDFENCAASANASHGHHGGGHGAASSRLLTSLPVISVGGLEDHRYFAEALLDRAQNISEDPAKETIILVSHGVGDEAGNEYWLTLLESLRAQMLEKGGDEFRGIQVATWREDWPDKRVAAIGHIRGLIEAAQANGGRALLVPARTTDTGNARELIPDMEYALASGFAPHPLFVRWLEEQVSLGIESLQSMQSTALRCESPEATDHHAGH
ncbi:MAG TPA: hypothetical protein VF275_00150 [Gammaproteobacteria bacterium]